MASYIFNDTDAKFFISIARVYPNNNKICNIPSFYKKKGPLIDKSIKLSNKFKDPKIVYFDGIHEFPSRKLKNEYNKCYNFMTSCSY